MRGRALAAGIAGFFCLALAAAEAGADADASWQKVRAFDEGPGVIPASREEAVRIAKAHFALHRAAIDAFVQQFPDDPRVFDARLKRAGIRAAEGKMENKPAEVAAALNELLALERMHGIPLDRQANAAFQRISLQMQTIEGRDEEIRTAVVTAARNFAARFPDDRRSPRLLVEAATLCDPVPDTMRDLLLRARQLSREPALDARIADDLRRMEAFGRPVDLVFDTMDGRRIDVTAQRGKVVVLVFWAAESPHSLLWMRGFLDSLRRLPREDLLVFGISLDEDRKNLDEAMRTFGINWPTHFDGKGWENAVARPLGINAIPTVWVIDRRGVLRSLNARDSYETLIRLVLRERG